MLPALPSPPLPSAQGRPWAAAWRTLALLACLLLLNVGLTACTRLPSPPQATVLSALSLQIELTQQAIATALDLPAPGTPSVRHVQIENQRSLAIGDGRGLQLSGHFAWRLGNDTTSTESPFELYLQRGERGQSWRLARPVSSGDGSATQQWLIDPLPIQG